MENERPIEKLLRRYAKKRRDDSGAPPGLHPATRHLLQGEVARQFPEGRRSARGSGSGIWTRWRLAIAVGALLAIVTAVLLPTLSRSKARSESLMALDRSASSLEGMSSADSKKEQTKMPEAPVAFAAAAAPPPASASPQSQVTGPTTMSGNLNAGVYSVAAVGYVPTTNSILPAGGTVTATTPAPTNLGLTPTGGEIVALSDSGLSAGPAQKSSDRSDRSVAKLDLAKNNVASEDITASTAYGAGQNIASRRFLNNAATGMELPKDKSSKSVEAAAVLNNFSCEQNGDQLRVVDGDGSIYFGPIEVAQAPGNGGTAGKSLSSAQVYQSGSQASQSYFFRVVGTNRTLNAKVVFTGSLTPQINAAQAQHVGGIIANNQQQNAANQQALPLLLNYTITGKAEVGSGTEVDINAVPVGQ